MPLLSSTSITNHITLYLWRIDETLEVLNKGASLTLKEKEKFKNIKLIKNKKQWLASKYIIRKHINSSGKLQYNENGKPYCNLFYDISISHSDNLIVLITSNKQKVGIDIETIGNKVVRIGDKFLHPEEKASFTESNFQLMHHIYWGAKEAIYKMMNVKGVEFKSQIRILAFELADEGKTVGTFTHMGIKENIEVFYKKINNSILVYTLNI